MYSHLLTAFCLSIPRPSSASPPHIILMLADDLGFNDVPWHNTEVLAPHLDSLAREGVVMEQHYSQPVCSPTRGALLTGRYPIHTGLHNGVITPNIPYGLDTRFITLPEELKRRGFDSFYGFLCGSQDHYTHTRKDGYDYRDGEDVAWEANTTYSTYLLQARAERIIESHDQRQPLFLYLPFQSVHGPLQVPQQYEDMYGEVEDPDRRTYLGMVTAMDDVVGNVTESLKRAGMYDNSVIIWFSDNGGPTIHGASNFPLRGYKNTLYEGGTRTPAIIHCPSLLPAGEVTNTLFHVTDWFPTILSMAGLSPSLTDLDGVDQWSHLQDLSLAPARQEMIYNVAFPHHDLTPPPISAIRRGEWKLIKRTNGQLLKSDLDNDISSEDARDLLFNLADDPEEKHNLYDQELWVVAELEERLDEVIAALPGEFYPEDSEAGDPQNFGGVWSDGWC